MTTIDPIIPRYIVDLCHSHQTGLDGVLLFGSRVRGVADACSDVDLICIAKTSSTRHIMLSDGHLQFDIEEMSIDDLARCIDPREWRNNHRLYALYTGVVIHDASGQLRDMQDRAKDLWESGPAPLTSSERQRILMASHKYAKTAQRICSRLCAVGNSATYQAVLDVQNQWVFQRLLGAHMRAHNRWVIPVWVAEKLSGDQYYDQVLERQMLFSRASALPRNQSGQIAALLEDIERALTWDQTAEG